MSARPGRIGAGILKSPLLLIKPLFPLGGEGFFFKFPLPQGEGQGEGVSFTPGLRACPSQTQVKSQPIETALIVQYFFDPLDDRPGLS